MKTITLKVPTHERREQLLSNLEIRNTLTEKIVVDTSLPKTNTQVFLDYEGRIGMPCITYVSVECTPYFLADLKAWKRTSEISR